MTAIPGGRVLETPRLRLSRLEEQHAPFILELLNDTAFLHYIGDKGVRTLEDAAQYIRKGPVASYQRHGYGLYLTTLREDGTPIGICGLVKRDALADPDVGFAFLPSFRNQGYGFESADAVLRYARNGLGLARVVAVVNPDNRNSILLLQKLGLRPDRLIQLPDSPAPSMLFVPPASPDQPGHGE